MKSTIFILFILSSIVSQNMLGQTNKITGTVSSFNRYALEGVQVKAKKSKQIVKTDSLGYFEITCNQKDVINISAAGFIGSRFSVKNSSHIKCNLVLMNGVSAQNKAVRGGYMTQEEMDYAMENLVYDNNDFSKYQSLCDLLQGEYPMARCSEEGGTNRVFLSSRPQTVLAGGWALCVVDGIVTEDITAIAPMQVASIEVLSPQDAASWGVRGGNGVLVITLKAK